MLESGGALSDLRVELRPSRRLFGNLAWSSGRPAVGFQVSLEGGTVIRDSISPPETLEAFLGVTREVTTDEAGNFVLSGLLDNDYSIRVSHKEEMLLMFAPLTQARSSNEDRFKLVIDVGYEASGFDGVLIDSAGRAVANALVRVRFEAPSASGLRQFHYGPEARSNDSGEFSLLPFSRKGCSLYVDAASCLPLSVPADSLSPDGVIRLQETAPIEIEWVDTDRVPSHLVFLDQSGNQVPMVVRTSNSTSVGTEIHVPGFRKAVRGNLGTNASEVLALRDGEVLGSWAISIVAGMHTNRVAIP